MHGHVTLLDLGVVRGTASVMTRPGMVIGTPGYMAPEQGEIDHRIDLFALGVVAYQLLAGRLPYGPKRDWQAMVEWLSEPPPALPTVSKRVSDSVRALA